MSNQDTKRHWYCFVFYCKTGVGSSYSGYPYQDWFNYTIIEHEKKNARVPEDSVLLSITYLGFMSKAEFLDASEAQ